MVWPESLTPKRLRYRIVAVFLGLLLLEQMVSLGLVSHSIGRSARASIEADLATGERVFERVLAQRAARLTDAARVLAADPGFRDAVTSQDAATLVSALENHAQRLQAPVALFTDARFQIKAATQPGAERFLPALQLMATDGGEPGGMVALEGQAYQLVVVPVKAPAVIGWVTLGFPIDDALLGEVKQLSTVDVALMWRHEAPPRWELRRSTLADAAALDMAGPWRRARALAVPGAAETEPFGASVEFDARPSGLLDRGHRMVAREIALATRAAGAPPPPMVALVLRSIDEATAPFDRLKWILLGCTLAGIVAFGIGSVFTAQRITTPLQRLTRAARRLSAGDYGSAVVVRGSDEIGALAGAFESMRLAVQQREREVTRIAFEDALTALPNRERLRVELRRAIEEARPQGGVFAVLRLDLGSFEQVNEVLGHRLGDTLLQQVAQRLLEHGRRDGRDVLARVGGNDFALLLPGADAQVGIEVAERIRRLLEQPIRIGDQTIDVHGSMGVACFPQHAPEADTLMNRCTIAMRTARRRGMGVLLYDSSMDASSAESLSLMSELRHALAHDQLRLYLQPKISLADGAVIGAEALVRWQHPERGLVPPIHFIPFAERSGFIRELTGWMLTRGTRVLRQLNAGACPLKLSINLSTRDLLDQDLPDKLRRLVKDQGLDPGSLCLEITESAIMDDPQRAMQTLEALHQLGHKLSIDDFGTGYSSLAYLKSMPVDELKIDKSFVLNMERDLDDAKIVRSTVDLAHNLGLTVVAEGVETAKAWKLLQALKCDEVQGYFIAKPMPEALFADWIRDWHSPAMNTVRLDTDFADLIS